MADSPEWMYQEWLAIAYVEGALPSAGALPDWAGLPGPVQIQWIEAHAAAEKAIRSSMALIPKGE